MSLQLVLQEEQIQQIVDEANLSTVEQLYVRRVLFGVARVMCGSEGAEGRHLRAIDELATVGAGHMGSTHAHAVESATDDVGTPMTDKEVAERFVEEVLGSPSRSQAG